MNRESMEKLQRPEFLAEWGEARPNEAHDALGDGHFQSTSPFLHLE